MADCFWLSVATFANAVALISLSWRVGDSSRKDGSGGWWPFGSQRVVVELQQITAVPGAQVLLTAPRVLNSEERAAVKEVLAACTRETGVRYAVLDGWTWSAIEAPEGAQQWPR